MNASEPHKQAKAMTWMAHLWSTKTGILSFQVLQEFYVTVAAKLQPGLDPENARKDLLALLAWRNLLVNDRVLENAWVIQDRCQISWWDALIISAAQLADCRYLLTEDLQEYQESGGLQVTNPFHVGPASLKPELVSIHKWPLPAFAPVLSAGTHPYTAGLVQPPGAKARRRRNRTSVLLEPPSGSS